MNRTTKFSIVLLLALMASAGAQGAMGTSALTSSTRELNGGTIYTMSEDVTINAAEGASALTVKSAGSGEGRVVVIDIQNGHTLTVKGGNANGKTGAGAGILLPEGMTLFVTGKGKLNATGGNAANGGNGAEGEQEVLERTGRRRRLWRRRRWRGHRR